MSGRSFRLRLTLPVLLAILFSLLGFTGGTELPTYAATTTTTTSANAAFTQAAAESSVPVDLLKALCYMEGRLSMHGGTPSMDNGFGCMHLVASSSATTSTGNAYCARGDGCTQPVGSSRVDTLGLAASLLHVSAQQLKTDLATNIRGGAAVLHNYALRLSPTLPTRLADWYGAVAAYSNASVRSTALMYADALYKILNQGFGAPTDTGEIVTLAAQAVQPNTATAAGVKSTSTLPAGCTIDNNVDYPSAVDCILDPNTFDCTLPQTVYPPCSYEERTDQPYPLPVDYVVIHDTEETLQGTLNTFQDSNPQTSRGVSVNYVVDTDGTVYQIVHDADFAYNVGNYNYNQHSVSIEHIGFDATGFLWYNAAQYLGSAKLVAYLLKKFNLPLDHNHVVSHGTVPPKNTTYLNHVDPGPYWLWDYYFGLINQQGIPFPASGTDKHIIMLRPATDRHPFNKNGTETPANFNFFYLYNGPSTASSLVAPLNPSDVTDETNNVEPWMSYYYLAKVKDPAGSGDTLYEIWYGDTTQTATTPPTYPESAQLAWLAVPPGAAVEGQGVAVTLTGTNGANPQIYGDPLTDSTKIIGDAPTNSVFASTFTLVEDNTTNLWYEINYNHRQAWVPASEVTVVHGILPG